MNTCAVDIPPSAPYALSNCFSSYSALRDFWTVATSRTFHTVRFSSYWFMRDQFTVNVKVCDYNSRQPCDFLTPSRITMPLLWQGYG